MRSHVHKSTFWFGRRISLELSDVPPQTDALRRHQKSRLVQNLYTPFVMLSLPRHNGVVIEPIDQDRTKSEAGSDEEGTSLKQKPKSRNGTTPDTPSATSHPQGIPHTLPFPPNSHYYRQHTMPTGKAHYWNFWRALFH